MQLSSTLRRLPRHAAAVDVSSLSGADAVLLLRLVNPSVTALLALRDALAARAVSANQHHAAGSKSGASFVGTETGVSERSARSLLARQRALDSLPDVQDKVRSGSLSSEKADVITGAAADDADLARDLLDSAETSTVEDLRQRAADHNARNKSHRKRLRDSQFISVTRDNDNMVLAQFKLLPDVAAPWWAEWQRLEKQFATSADRAEAFSKMIGGGSGTATTATVSFHVDIDSPDFVHMGGVGVVPASVMAPYFDDAALQLLIKVKNKLIWYSESRNHKGPLAEFIKRAVKSFNYDKCASKGCVEFATQVDHNQARINGGTNEFDNLRPLCEAHHHAKTRQDAPWTADGIYGRVRTEHEGNVSVSKPAQRRRSTSLRTKIWRMRCSRIRDSDPMGPAARKVSDCS